MHNGILRHTYKICFFNYFVPVTVGFKVSVSKGDNTSQKFFLQKFNMGHHKMPDLLLILNPLKKKVSIKSYTQKTFEYSTSTQVIRQKPNFFYHISLIAFSHDFLTLFQRIQNNIKFYVFYNEYIEFCQKKLF